MSDLDGVLTKVRCLLANRRVYLCEDLPTKVCSSLVMGFLYWRPPSDDRRMMVLELLNARTKHLVAVGRVHLTHLRLSRLICTEIVDRIHRTLHLNHLLDCDVNASLLYRSDSPRSLARIRRCNFRLLFKGCEDSFCHWINDFELTVAIAWGAILLHNRLLCLLQALRLIGIAILLLRERLHEGGHRHADHG